MRRAADMAWQIVPLDTVAPVPWKNGGGLTRELLRWPLNSETWRVRISVAEVTADGPFSQFENTERWFAVLSGAGVALDINSVTTELTRCSEPLQFAGESATYCRLLAGPTQDFNLMLRATRGRLRRIADRATLDLSQCILAGLYSSGACTVVAADGQFIDVPPNSLCWRVLPEPPVKPAYDVVTVAGGPLLTMEIDR